MLIFSYSVQVFSLMDLHFLIFLFCCPYIEGHIQKKKKKSLQRLTSRNLYLKFSSRSLIVSGLRPLQYENTLNLAIYLLLPMSLIFSCFLIISYHPFILAWRTPFSISYKLGLVIIDSLSSCLSGKVFISPSVFVFPRQCPEGRCWSQIRKDTNCWSFMEMENFC